MKKIIITLTAFVLSISARAQDANILTGLGAPVYGVRIKANFPGANTGWARGYYVVNQDNSENFLGLGVTGSITNGVSGMSYGWIGKDFNQIYMSFFPTGNVGIGTINPTEKLSVKGKIRAQEIKVEAVNWPDYVFDEGYKVETLKELESYIKTNKHLPGMPTAKQIETDGLELGEMVKLQQQKIEELTLHLIEKDKQMNALQAVVEEQVKIWKAIQKKK
jgi:hypothetical protein